jgi:hypothetical protein
LRQRLLFIGMFSNADDEGRMKASPLFLKATVFPYDSILPFDIHEDSMKLHGKGIIQLYTVKGEEYLQIPKWKTYQKPQYPKPSKLPSFTEADLQEIHGDFHEASMKDHKDFHEASLVGWVGLGWDGLGIENSNSLCRKSPTSDADTPNNIPLEKEKKKIEKKKIAEDSEAYALANYFLGKLREDKPDFKQPNMQEWAADMDKLIRIDGRTDDRIKHVIDWCRRDDFWKTNILSPAKLRKQFDQLEMKSGSGKGRQDLAAEWQRRIAEDERKEADEENRIQQANGETVFGAGQANFGGEKQLVL